jgi:hypothetical protein
VGLFLRLRLRDGVCIGLGVEVDTEDGAELIIVQGITHGNGSGVG